MWNTYLYYEQCERFIGYDSLDDLVKIDKKYASIFIYPHNTKNLHDIIDCFDINKITGIKFLSANYTPHTCINFKHVKDYILIHIFLYDNTHNTDLYFKDYNNIPKIQEDIVKLKETYLCNVDLLIDRIIRYKSNY